MYFLKITKKQKPGTENRGALILQKANPSGLPENDDALEILVKFKQETEDIAKVWIKNNSSTYKFDGMDLELVETRGLDLVGCEDCYEAEFKFNSSHAGYRNREGQILAQVITPHIIVVTIKNSKATKVITDQKYDEINQEIIDG